MKMEIGQVWKTYDGSLAVIEKKNPSGLFVVRLERPYNPAPCTIYWDDKGRQWINAVELYDRTTGHSPFGLVGQSGWQAELEAALFDGGR